MVAPIAPVLVKCYAGSRLYDTGAGRYVSMEQLRQWLARGVSFRVVDAITGADLTRVLLA
jgi:polyhydroxyalkanoate synthesis regulator protein